MQGQRKVPPLKSSDSATSVREMLAAVNYASAAARNSWLAFIGLMTYLAVTLAGVSHKDLFLDTEITLPFVRIGIPLTSFFFFAPILILFSHIGLLMQHRMLRQKLLAFNRTLPASNIEKQHIRDEIHSYFFTQIVVGKPQKTSMRFAFQFMTISTLILAPVILLFVFQIRFLPFHLESATWAHRIYLLFDIALLWTIGIFLSNIKTQDNGIGRLYALVNVPIILILFTSIFVASVPDKTIDKMMSGLAANWTTPVPIYCNRQRHLYQETRKVFTLTAWLFERKIFETKEYLDLRRINHKEIPFSCSITSWFNSMRNLNLADIDVVPDKKLVKGEPSYFLRKRNFDYADFSDADLKQIDFSNSSLQGANLIGSNLKKTIFRAASLQGANLGKADLQSTNLVMANLQGTMLRMANLQGANLFKANLQGAFLGQAKLQSAIFLAAKLQGANLGKAKLQNADLRANLLGAYLWGANLQGADLNRANLQGANLNKTNLQGANLNKAKLQGAEFRWASLQGTDFGKAQIWETYPPKLQQAGNSKLNKIRINANDKKIIKNFANEIRDIQKLAKQMQSDKTPGHKNVAATLKKLQKIQNKHFTKANDLSWLKNPKDFCTWQSYTKHPVPSPESYAKTLGEVACNDDTDKAYKASRLTIRIINQKLHAPSFFKQLNTCPTVTARLPKNLMAALKQAAKNYKPPKPTQDILPKPITYNGKTADEICTAHENSKQPNAAKPETKNTPKPNTSSP